MLARIVESKRHEVERLLPSETDIREAAERTPPPRDFRAALSGGHSVHLIAECKRRSPGAGPIRPDLDPLSLALGYGEAGASALSCLTDEEYFGGTLDDLRAISRGAGVPVLRKDFVLEPVQLFEARAAGADAILLIVRILDDRRLTALLETALALGMAALVEAHDALEVERALSAGAQLIGINNRDLATFTTDLDTTLGLIGEVPPEVTVVSESGIRSRHDVALLGSVGVDAILVGESLLRAHDPSRMAAELSGVPKAPR